MAKKGILYIFLAIATSLNFLYSQTLQENSMIKPPVVEKKGKELTNLGHTRIDNYYWLNERENPKVIDYLNAENSYTKQIMLHTEPLQDKLYNEIIGRIKQTDNSVPYFEGGFFYYTRFEEGKEYPIYCRKKGDMSANEEILLNVNELAKGHDYYQVAGMNISPNKNLLAYGVDVVSRRIYTIYIKDLTTGKLLEDIIPNNVGSVAWGNDNKTFYYTVKDSTLRAFQIYRHILGENSKNDKLIYEESDDTYSCYAYKTKSKKYIIISSHSTLTTEYRILDADTPQAEFSIFEKRERGIEYDVDHYNDKFYIKTNWNAKNFKLMECGLTNTAKANWKDVIPGRADVLLEGMEIFNDFLVLQERKSGLIQLRVINQKNKSEHYLDFGEQTYVAWIGTNPEFNSSTLRFGFSSLTVPTSTFDYDMITKEKKLLKQEEIVGGYNSSDYVSERLYAKAKDGTLVPISLVYKKGIKKDGKNPLLLYAYGSYGYSTDPYFSSVRLSLLNRGVIFAIAHIRGGEEMGRDWYEDGKLLKKKNTFTDFIDCAEKLIAENYTSPEHLFANGGSAGGLLMGAIANMRPDLWKGVIAQVPFVDVVTTMLDTSIPLTTGEYDEWGNPNEKAYYDYMLSYSPYDNVEPKVYPNMLVTTGLHDSQVQYFEPAKWVAKLRELKKGNNILLLDTDMAAGHGGASGRFFRYKKTALVYAFLLDLAGVKE